MKEKIIKILTELRPEFDFTDESFNFIEEGMLDSFDVVSLSNNAELFDRPLCGFSMNQFPVFAFAISSSSGENKQIVADRLTPPDKTASETCITISYATIGLNLVLPSANSALIKVSILISANCNASGPGALNPPEINEPLGLIFSKLK